VMNGRLATGHQSLVPRLSMFVKMLVCSTSLR
jgi:hypothetical protein